MKIAIVYYSLEGHTHFIAEKMGKQISGDLIRLIPKKDFPTGSFGKYFWGGKSATFHEKPKLSNEMLQLDSYDAIIVGTPTWAGTMAPPVRTFLAHAVIKGKPVYLLPAIVEEMTRNVLLRCMHISKKTPLWGVFHSPSRMRGISIP